MNIHYPRGRLLLLLWQPNNRGTNYHNNTSSFEDWGQRDTPWLVERLKRKEMRPYCRKWWVAWFFGVLSLVLWPLAVLMLSAFIDLSCMYLCKALHAWLSLSLSLQCTVNGLNYDKLSQGAGLKLKCLEVFFFGCPRIVGLSHFPSLSVLRIINQRISRMMGVGSCPSLKELWICEGDIEVRP